MEEYQMRELNKLLHHAYNNVPYYRNIFNERGLKPQHIQDLNDLKKLPCLTKDAFKKHFTELTATNYNLKNCPMSHTSGTSGKPLQFYQDLQENQREWAFVCHQWSRVGFNPGDPRVELRGSIIEGKKPIVYDPVRKVLRLSPRLGSKEIVNFYVEKISRFGAKFLHGYPSAIALFASMVKQYGLSVPFKLQAVLFASEAVYPWERCVVEEVFNCRVFGFYGMAEHAVIAAECEHSSNYHCVPQYGITEIDPTTNEIIGTSFLNFVNPFIRYRTTDSASSPINSYCGECDRQYFPVFSGIEGRLEDFIITPEGVPVSPAVITHPFKDFKTIKDTQIIQKSLNYVKLRMVLWDDHDLKMLEDELQQLCQGLQNILGPIMKIETEIVDSIQLSKSGKFRWIISEVSKDFLEKGVRGA